MLFIPRILLTVGAFIASTRRTLIRTDPGGSIDLIHQGLRSFGTARLIPSSTGPAHSLNPSNLPSPFVTPKGLFSSVRRFARIKGSESLAHPTLDHAPVPSPTRFIYLNTTRANVYDSVESIVFTSAPYDGSKDLMPYDNRRALAIYPCDGSRDLVVYDRPSSLAIYTGQTDVEQLGTDYYQLVAYVYRPWSVIGTPIFKEYSHLDPTNFDRWGVDNPVELMLVSQHPRLLCLFNSTPSGRLTIGDFTRRPEERASQALAHVHALGILFAILFMAYEEYLQLGKALDRRHKQQLLITPTDGIMLESVPTLGPLTHGQMEPNSDGEEWWWGAIEGEYVDRVNRLIIQLPHITSDSSHLQLVSPPPPTRAHIVNRRRCFLRALAELESGKGRRVGGSGWDLD